MKFYKKLQIIAFVLLFASLAFGQMTADGFTRSVNDITSGANSMERGAQIREELEKIGVKFTFEPFTAKARSGGDMKGWNIIAEIPNPKATKTLLLGAHYDRVSQGKGAVDNASGSAAILELLKVLKANPLQNYAVKVAFWDLEELGLIGSNEYIKARTEAELPTVYINFDVFGYGDTLWLWTQKEGTIFSKAVDEAAKQANVKANIGTQYPPSDHLTFAETKTETYSFSLINGDEIPNLLKAFKGESLKQNEMPRVLQIIHSNNDTADKIDANAVAKALPVIEQAIRKLDK